ncbi:MAG TPA: GNAT family N-acetyltransferase [Solirubrobacterales bacterium]
MAAPSQLQPLLDFELALHREVADRVVERAWGTAFISPSVPRTMKANWISVERPGLTAAELVAHAEELLGGAGLPHRALIAYHVEAGVSLAAEFRRREGWKVERALYMRWRGDGGLRQPVDARETGLAEIAGLRRALLIENGAPGDDDPQLTATHRLEVDRRFGELTGDRWFCAPAAGEPQSTCRLYMRGPIAQVEDVGTLTPARGRGLAQSVVRATIAAARSGGAETIFLCADAEDWPRLMYERLGFEPLGELPWMRRRNASPPPRAQTA